ncbi:CbtA family protein [Streptomyces sp. NPDC088348]|uniref:CbtA family protein n=1 Tax=Streptomyces sp. NPDC088348 TaxID=3365853 RepID=UPI003808603B
MSAVSTSRPVATPVVLPISTSVRWLVGAALIAPAVYHFIGVDQGAVSVFGDWNATLRTGAALVVAIGIVMLLLPQLGHLASDKENFGRRATETPLPLVDSKGHIVYPGFPADVLFAFRFCPVAAQLILWTVIGLVFAPLAERLLRPARPDAAAPSQEPDPVPA